MNAVDNPEQVEMGSKNHEIVPLPLIVQISGLRNGGVNKLVGSLAKRNLISKVQNAKCEMFSCAIRIELNYFQMMDIV